MASNKKPSNYSNEELETYGVWVKSEPQDFTASLDVANFIEDALPYEAAFDTGFDDMGAGTAGYDLLDAELHIPEVSLDNDEAISGAGQGEEASTQMLMKIASELSSIRTELNTLKREFAEIRGDSAFETADEDEEKIALSGDEMDSFFNVADFPDSTREASASLEADASREADSAALKELDAQNEAEEIHIDFDNLGIDLDSIGDVPSDAEEPQEEGLSLDEGSSLDELPPLEGAIDNDDFEIPSFEALSFDETPPSEASELDEGEQGFAEELVPLEGEDEELKTLRLEGAESLAPPPDNADYLETDPFALNNADLESALSEDFDLEPMLEETVVDVEEPALEETVVDVEEPALEETVVDVEEAALEEAAAEVEEPALEETVAEVEEPALEIEEPTPETEELNVEPEEAALEEAVVESGDAAFDELSFDDSSFDIGLEDFSVETSADEVSADESTSEESSEETNESVTEPVVDEPAPDEELAETPVEEEESALDDISFADDISLDMGDFESEPEAESELDSPTEIDSQAELDAPADEPAAAEFDLGTIELETQADDQIEDQLDEQTGEEKIVLDDQAGDLETVDMGEEISLDTQLDDLGTVDFEADLDSAIELEPEVGIVPEGELETEPEPEPILEPKVALANDIISDIDDSVIPEGLELDAKEAEPSVDDDLEAFAGELAVTEDESPSDSADKLAADRLSDDGGEFDAIPIGLKNELKNVLSYMDHLLESLPEDKIEEFAQSEYFEKYKKIFKELGLV